MITAKESTLFTIDEVHCSVVILVAESFHCVVQRKLTVQLAIFNTDLED